MITPFTYPSPLFTETSAPLEQLPDDVILEITIGKLKRNEFADDAIVTLFKLSKISKKMNQKIQNFLITFIRQLGEEAFLLDAFPKTLDFKNITPESSDKAYQFLKNRYLAIKRLKNIDPEVPEDTKILIDANTAKCFINNPKGYTELWTLNGSQDTLTCTDLKTQESFQVILPEHVLPVFFGVGLKMAVLDDNKIAICCRATGGGCNISIIDKDTGVLCHKIEKIDTSVQFEGQHQYLYLLCKNENGEQQMLQYDSKNWNGLPKKSLIPGANEFHFTNHGLLLTFNDYRIALIENIDDFYSNPKPKLIERDFLTPLHLLNITKDGIWAWNPDNGSSRENPSAWLVNLHVEDSFIRKRLLQQFPLNRMKIWAYEVFYDKVIVFQNTGKGYGCVFYDIKTGKLIKEFDVRMETDYSSPFYALKVLPDKTIQLAYLSAANLPSRRNICIKTFDFKICEDDVSSLDV